MFQKYISRRRKFSLFSFIVALLVLLFFSFLSFRQIKSLQKTEQLVTQSYQVKVLLEQLLSNNKDAETGLLRYAITKDSNFLTPYLSVQPKSDSIFNKLRVLTTHDSLQQKNLESIQPLIGSQLEALSQLRQEVNKQNHNAKDISSEIKSMSTSSQDIMSALQQKINNMILREDVLLQERKEAHKNELTITPYFALLLLAFSILKFFTAFYVINNDFKKINTVTNELKLINDSFEHAEEIAKISHWQWNLSNNKQIFSGNQYLMLGCTPGEFEPTAEAYLNFVHPDDRERYLSDKQNLLNNNESTDTIYRIIRKDGALRYFKSTGRVLTDENREKVIVGIKLDITEQYLVSKELEERNIELTNRNIELASFNYIASHDLQEPLRKIQLFISKILDDSELKLTDKNLDYFNRMQASANRMQNLIGDLLTYSKTNAGDKTFESTDTNAIIGAIRNELDADGTIADKNITIHLKDLPIVNGIPFQLKQLFANLIDNAIKYNKPMRPLVINIEAFIVASHDIQDFQDKNPEKKYHKITVSDNGIGFEQNYSKQIFTLFQRLHDKKSYSGTGIGLAICKKVVENHNGYISASGELNKGATFDIYLPV